MPYYTFFAISIILIANIVQKEYEIWRRKSNFFLPPRGRNFLGFTHFLSTLSTRSHHNNREKKTLVGTVERFATEIQTPSLSLCISFFPNNSSGLTLRPIEKKRDQSQCEKGTTNDRVPTSYFANIFALSKAPGGSTFT